MSSATILYKQENGICKYTGCNDDSILFDTPHLNNIYASAPYLHDGRAATLEEIWTKYGKDG